jgi:thioredoxin reductase
MASDQGPWDCIVVGGGAAGLSAALVLGRARKRTLVVDAGEPSNRFAEGIGGLLGSDHRPPQDFYAAARAELEPYPAVDVRSGEVVRGERNGDDSFALELSDGSAEHARRVVLATGMDYRYPDLPGVAERWGRAVFHCPFCHGWEVRDQPLAVLDSSEQGIHRSILLTSWSDDVTLLTNGPAAFDASAAERLRAAGVEVDERPVARVAGPGEAVDAVEFADGDQLVCHGVLVGVTLHQRSDLGPQLGAELAPPNPVFADALEVDGMLRTTSPGVFAAGDVSAQGPTSVALAVAAGSTAANGVVASLLPA